MRVELSHQPAVWRELKGLFMRKWVCVSNHSTVWSQIQHKYINKDTRKTGVGDSRLHTHTNRRVGDGLVALPVSRQSLADFFLCIKLGGKDVWNVSRFVIGNGRWKEKLARPERRKTRAKCKIMHTTEVVQKDKQHRMIIKTKLCFKYVNVIKLVCVINASGGL